MTLNDAIEHIQYLSNDIETKKNPFSFVQFMMHAGFDSDIDKDTHVEKNKLTSLLFPYSVSSLFKLLRLKYYRNY